MACGSPPGAPDPASFEWQVALSELDDAVLAVCSGADRLLAVGGTADRSAVYEWRGDRWQVPLTPAGAGLLWWCWIDDDGRAYAVGENRTVIASEPGAPWTREVVPASEAGADVTLYGVWGTGPDDVIAVGGSLAPGGDRGVILARDGDRWRRVREPSLPAEILFKAWSAPGGALWIVGSGGAIVTRDGSGWHPVASPTSDRLIAVWGTASDDVYAVGGDGAGLVLRYDGRGWSTFDRPPSRVSGVYAALDGPLYVAGDRGFVARYRRGADGRPSASQRDARLVLDAVDLHAVSAVGELVVVAGADLLGGNTAHWHGAMLTHRGSLGSDVDRAPMVDAGPEDAATQDAAPADAGPLPGRGQACAVPPPNCQPELECWGLVESDEFLCTERCASAADCVDPGYGPTPCCAIPGFQTLQTVCIPGDRAECG